MPDSLITNIQFKEEKTEYRVHYHHNYEILYITSGRCAMSVNNATYVAKTGDIVLIGNQENHCTKILEPPFARYVLTINPLLFNQSIENHQLIAMFKQRKTGFCHCLPMPTAGIEAIFQKIYAEKQNKDIFSDTMCNLYLKMLLIEIFRAHPSNFENEMDKTSETILIIQNYIDTHFDEEIRLDKLAKQFFMNKYYLSHSFKTFAGISPKQYLTQVRLNHALHLLTHTNFTISEICEKCGFPDINNFIRTFKSHFSKTPGSYRENYHLTK